MLPRLLLQAQPAAKYAPGRVIVKLRSPQLATRSAAAATASSTRSSTGSTAGPPASLPGVTLQAPLAAPTSGGGGGGAARRCLAADGSSGPGVYAILDGSSVPVKADQLAALPGGWEVRAFY
jgi:hypothetical protein